MVACGSRHRSLTAQEALAAEHRPALSGLKGYRGFPTALGARGHGLRLAESRRRTTLALGLASFAALWLVLEILIVEEVLFSRCEYEIRPAVYALEDAVLKIRHGTGPIVNPKTVADKAAGLRARRRGFTLSPGVISSGFACGPAPAWPGASHPALGKRSVS